MEKYFLPDTLTHSPRPYTVMEWRYAIFIQPIYELAQSNSIFAALTAGHTTTEHIAEYSGLSVRGTRCVLRCLTAAGVLALENGHYQCIAEELPAAFRQARSLFYELCSSIEAGVFVHVDTDGVLPADAPQGLVTLGIAERQGEQVVLTEPGRRYFTPGHELYLGNYVLGAVKSLEMQLPHLQKTVKTGQRLLINDPRFFASTIDILFLMNYGSALHLAEFLATKDGISTALDLGAGSGVWSIPLARTNPNVRITAFDSAFVLEKTRAYTTRHGVYEQYRYQEVDFTTQDDWGNDPYDVIYLCHFSEGYSVEGNQQVITRCVRHLRPGGYLVITDFMPAEDWSEPLLDVLFSIQMLYVTDSDGPYTWSAYKTWLDNAGLTDIEMVSLPGTSTPAIVLRKNGILM